MTRQLDVFSDYSGRRTREQRIKVGVYDEGDPRLYGLEEFLVEQGKAAWIAEPPDNVLAFAVTVYDHEGTAYDADAVLAHPRSASETAVILAHEEIMAQMGRTSSAALFVDPNAYHAPEPVAITYDDMTVEQLRAECERREIDLSEMEGSGASGKLLKADLVYILQGDDADNGVASA